MLYNHLHQPPSPGMPRALRNAWCIGGSYWMIVIITTTIWYEGRKWHIQSIKGVGRGRNNSGTEAARKSWSLAYLLPDAFWLISVWRTYAHGCHRNPSKCACLCMCALPSMRQHVSSAKANIVFLTWLPCQASLAPSGRMSAIGWRMRVLFPRQLNSWQRSISMPTGVSWVGGLLRLLIFPQGLCIAVQNKTVTHPAW